MLNLYYSRPFVTDLKEQRSASPYVMKEERLPSGCDIIRRSDLCWEITPI